MFDKNIKNKQKIILAAIFIFVFAAGFGLGKSVNAESCECVNIDELNNTGKITYLKSVDKSDEASCRSYCGSQNSGLGDAYRFNGGTTSFTKTSGEVAKLEQGASDICGWVNWLSGQFFNCLLLKVLTFIGYLVSAAATLFEWIIDANNLKTVLNNDIIYTIWGTVRDVLNIAFILVLLFSAFCTVFQVEKFNYKQILRTLIIMALLVNFSFPISRVIIDFSNVIMFSFLKSMGGADSFAQIAESGRLAKIINPETIPDISYLFAAIVFTFILAVTFIVIAVLMVIRTIALAILIIFSPVAFVGSIVPFLSSKAGAWWDNLFKYSFFGPIMVFMMYIAVEMMNVIALQASSFDNIAKIQTSGDSMAKLVSSYASFAIPIVILWIGIGTAQTMSIAGASAVVGRGQKFMKSVGGWTVKAPFRGAWWGMKTGAKVTGIPGGVQQRYGEIKDKFKSSQDSKSAKWAAKFGSKGAEERDMRKRADDYKKNFEPIGSLKSKCASGDVAACYRLAEDKDIDQTTYDKFTSQNKNKKGGQNLQKALDFKVKQNRADLVIANKVNNLTTAELGEEKAKGIASGTLTAASTHQEVRDYVSQKEFGSLSAEKLADQDWATITADINKIASPATKATEKKRVADSMIHAIGKLKGPAQAELIKRIGTTKIDEINNFVRSQYPGHIDII